MRRIGQRAWALLLLMAILLGGTGFFAYEYGNSSSQWALHPANGHVYQGANRSPAMGTVTDRQGNFLLHFSDGRVYASDPQVRMAMLHWLGDRSGNISAPALQSYAAYLAGYDPLSGLYTYGGMGGTMELTLSSQIQQTALEAMGSYKGTVAVYNYQTGELLCAVSTPTFDPDDLPDLSGEQYEGVYLNRFTQAVYIPGSIFKVVTTAAALEEIEDIETQVFTCTATLELPGGKVTCETAHGTLDLKTAMMRSCNCAYAQIAQQLGQQTLAEYVMRFGVTKRVSFDGIVTAAGSVPLEGLSPVELGWAAIGQHKDQINPCAYLTFMGAIAGGGRGAIPYVVSSVSADGKLTHQASAQYTEPIMSGETAAILQEYMRNNVQNYYGDQHFPGLTVCAKSGTGEVDGDQLPYAMFAGFVADDAYPLAFLVAVEDAGYGRTVCIPILSKVLAQCKGDLG